MSLPVIEVDLSRPPEERWLALADHATALRRLLAMYVRDLGGIELFRDALTTYRDTVIPEEYAREMMSIAAIADADPLEVILANSYYDVFKHLVGCTAFATDGPDGPIHARNLDWWSEGNALNTHSIVVRYHRAGVPVFDAVTWPGFVGTLSGMAHGRFSVTLNAVLSEDAPGIALPIGLLLRELLTTASYADAKAALEQRPIACDCLLLVVGVERGEMCVIERTPLRSAVREATHGVIVVTNDYRLLASTGSAGSGSSPLEATSCGRFDRADARICAERPATIDECYAILDDKNVRMDMTVQQMVMSAGRGLISARRPS